MENIGGKLKEKRQDKKLSIDEVSKRTKIQKHILEALEQGGADEILGPVYAKSFLKQYAQFLGLKFPENLKQDGLAPAADALVLNVSQKKGKSKDLDWRGFIPLINKIVIVIVIMASAVLLVKIVRFAHDRAVSSSKKKVKVEKTVKTTASSPAFAAKKSLPPPSTQSPAKITPSRLLLKSKKDVWMQVKADGRIVFEGFFKRASQEEWAFEKELHLWVGNAAFVELTLNGKYYGSPGKGVIKDIIVTKEGIKIK